MTFSSFAITAYFNTKHAPQVAGEIAALDYWHEGLTYWVTLGEMPPQLPAGTALHLLVWWVNHSSQPICGHVKLVVTRPDRSQIAPVAVLNQDRWADPGNGWAVQFEPVTLDQSGEYQAKVALSTIGQVLDEKTDAMADTTPGVEIAHFTWVPDTYVVTLLPSEAQSWRTVGFGFDFRNNGAEPIEAYVRLILKHRWRPEDEREQSFWAWRGVLVDGMQTWQPLTVYADLAMPIFYWNPYPEGERESSNYDRCFLIGKVMVNEGVITTATSNEFDVWF